MNNFDSEFEDLRMNFEGGKIQIDKLNNEQMERLSKYYKDEITSNKREIVAVDEKIKSLKNKIDNLV